MVKARQWSKLVVVYFVVFLLHTCNFGLYIRPGHFWISSWKIENKVKLSVKQLSSQSIKAMEEGHTFRRVVELLSGEWWSRQLGHIFVHADLSVLQGDGALTLQVTKASELEALNSSTARSRASTHIKGWRQDGQLFVELHIGARRLSHAKQLSRRFVVIWTDYTGSEADHWDKRWLAQIRKGAEWVDAPMRGLDSNVLAGLQRLGSGEQSESSRTVGLCVTTKNRLWQLRRALPLNLLHAWPHRSWVKIHLVVCDCTDNTLDWVLKNCRPAMDADLLRVYDTDCRMPYWHACIGKNTSHMVAKEDILVNVDGDNLIGPDFPVDVLQNFDKGYKVLQYEHGDGTCGRIACLRHDFLEIRGYDEDAYPMGAQDTDLVLRLRMLHGEQMSGKKKNKATSTVYINVRSDQRGQAIPNEVTAKVSCCSPKYGHLRWGQMDSFNQGIFALRRDTGQIKRNLDKDQIGVYAKRVRPL